MMWWNGYNGGWMIVGMLAMFIFFIAVAAIIVWVVRGASGHVSGSSVSGALDIAKNRYAKGEITKEQYDKITKNLS